jgi:hypothetical protein
MLLAYDLDLILGVLQSRDVGVDYLALALMNVGNG